MPHLRNIFWIRLCRPQQLAAHGSVGPAAFQIPALLPEQLLIGCSCIAKLSPCYQGVSAQPDEALGSWASDRLINFALAQAVQGTIKAVNLLREIRQIQQQCDDLKKEIVTIDGFILEAMRQTGLPLRPQPPPGTTQEHPMVSLAIQELQGILEALNQTVSKYTNDRKWHDPRRIARKMQWLYESKKIEVLARKAQDTKHDLHLAITSRTSSSVDRIGTQQEVILHSIKQRTVYYLEGNQQSQTGLLNGPISGPIQAPVLGPVERQVEEIESEGDSCSETSEASTQSMTDSLKLGEFQSRFLSDESGGCAIYTQEESYMSITAIQPLGTRRCGQDCQCRCHGNIGDEGLALFPDDTNEFGFDLIGKAIVDQAYESIEILLEMWKNAGLTLVYWRVGYVVNFTLVHCSSSVTDDNTRHVLAKVLSFAQGCRRTCRIYQAAKQGDTVQMRQALREQPEAIDELDHCGCSSIHYAVMYDHIDVLEQLILAGSDTIRRVFDGNTPLMVAAIFGLEEAVQILLQNDQCRRHVDLQGNVGKTALHWAVRKASPECVHMLLEAGAQADQQTAHRIIRLLQGQHARLDAQNDFGVTPLLQAVMRNNASVLRALVDVGASLNTTTTSSENILHFAACCADLEMMSYLAEQHLTLVDPRLRDVDGFTPLGRLGWCWEAEDWQLYSTQRRPSPED
ncbi:hypothetical protein NCS56_01207800 [Fusarium sp. Ph1]|nr:hypothetical protein NCS56_01207800 [Fusarium sp. Ph1]